MDELLLGSQPWWLALLCVVLQSMSKAGIAGLGMLSTPVMASLFEPRTAVGIILPILIVGDVFAVAYYHRHANWPMLTRLVPVAFVGIVLGSVIMGQISDDGLRIGIGVVILLMVVLTVLRNRGVIREDRIPKGWGVAILTGLVAGVTTMVAHAAGPVMQVYLLAMGLKKEEFIGTGAWFFLLVNVFKVPFYLGQGLITPATLRLDVKIALGIPLGVVAGIWIARRLSNRSFAIWVEAMTALAALRLLLG